ncbi:MAG: AAA family ATPase [Cytophagales bacterium]
MQKEKKQHLEWFEIKNFKSIKHIRSEAKKVNVFIGEPNVGKSNLLEALGALNPFYSVDSQFLKGIVRYENLMNLFYDEVVEDQITIESNLFYGEIDYKVGQNNLGILYKVNNDEVPLIGILNESGLEEFSISYKPEYIIKKFQFKNEVKSNVSFSKELIPPFGNNIFSVVDNDESLKSEITTLFRKQNLDFVLYKSKKIFEIEKKVNGYVYKYPYSSIADTYQRYIFYLAAIRSNKDSIIIFEEPEVHSFPPFVRNLAEEIVADETNQYFISTHSPYLLLSLIENIAFEDLNIFLTSYENNETKIKSLSQEKITEILDFNMDVFFNLEKLMA